MATGLFTDAFKAALSEALERSDTTSLSPSEVSHATEDTYEEVASPCDPNDDVLKSMVPSPRKNESGDITNSAQEDMLFAALEASKTSLSRLMAMQNEINRAIEREVCG